MKRKIEIEPMLCPSGDPYDSMEMITKTVELKTGDKVIFRQENVEYPASWSSSAAYILASKFFLGHQGTPQRESSIKDVLNRIVGAIASYGKAHDYFDSRNEKKFSAELKKIMLDQMAAFNSPVFFNVGRIENPQGAACFILSIKDNLKDITKHQAEEITIFSNGSGTGVNLSGLRGVGEPLTKGGWASGPMSFAKGQCAWAGIIRSGGILRRAAKLIRLDDYHPDVFNGLEDGNDFISFKTVEEKKARTLWETGYTADLAYASVAGQTANFSVGISNRFMQAVLDEKEWSLKSIVGGKLVRTFPAKNMFASIAKNMYECGDPGIQFDDHINDWWTCPKSGKIRSSNPCVAGDSLVSTASGLRRIQTLIGEKITVAGSDGDWHPVNGAFKTGTKRLYEVRTLGGYSVKVTADHRFQTINRGDVPTYALMKGDLLRLGHVGFGHKELDEATGTLIGAAAGDGCRSGDTAVVTVNKNNKIFADYLTNSVNRMKEEGARQSNPTDAPTASRISASNESVRNTLSLYVILDEGSDGKRFTDAVFELNQASVAAILRGLFETDGTVANYGDKSNYISLDSTSKELLRQVQILLLGFRIKSKICEDRNAMMNGICLMPDGKGGQKEYCIKPLHSLRISRNSRVKFEELIGFMPAGAKQEKLHILNSTKGAYMDRMCDPIESITELVDAPVYDLTEPATEHFIANGLVVHNCSEFLCVDNSACNLASLNLGAFFSFPEGIFHKDEFLHVVRLMIIAQDILVDMCGYPTPEITKNSAELRPLGLGYCNLGGVLMGLGLPYDSEEGRTWASLISALLTGQAYKTSIELAEILGSFKEFTLNKKHMMKVIRKHVQAIDQIMPKKSEQLPLVESVQSMWNEVLKDGEKIGFRNCQVTLLAPTGTIGILMDVVTTGIEPENFLVRTKKMIDGGELHVFCPMIGTALESLGYPEETRKKIKDVIAKTGEIANSGISAKDLPVFHTAYPSSEHGVSIAPSGHLLMMAAVQPFISGGISKTIGQPENTNAQNIEHILTQAWKLGLKCVTVYRDGSKIDSPLKSSLIRSKKTGNGKERLPNTCRAERHRFLVGGTKGYLITGHYPDNRVGEIFVSLAKEGSTLSGLMDCFATSVSMALQHGVPLSELIAMFAHQRFEPMGHTDNPDLRFCSSIIDYIFRYLEKFVIKDEDTKELAVEQSTGLPCPVCGNIMTRLNSVCMECRTCNEVKGMCSV